MTGQLPGTTNDVRPADFNGDGKPDLITFSSNSGAYFVLLGNGDGTFGTLTPSSSPECATANFPSIAIGDFNLDGKMDIAGPARSITNSPVIRVCLGNGDGTFTFFADFDTGIQHTFILPGDFNHDGKLDLATSDEHGISILLGNGDGSFQSGIPTALNATFPLFTAGDFNGDGKLDVAATTAVGISVLLGNGDGTFKAPRVSTGPTHGFLAVGDLNKDGKMDLVSSGVAVFLGKGDGTFEAPLHFPVSGPNSRPILADLNGDGNLDVAVATNAGVSVLLGDGNGNLMAPEVFRAPRADGIASGKFNGNKSVDLVLVLNTGVIVTLLNQK